jgi:hypothetical protein
MWHRQTRVVDGRGACASRHSPAYVGYAVLRVAECGPPAGRRLPGSLLRLLSLHPIQKPGLRFRGRGNQCAYDENGQGDKTFAQGVMKHAAR